MRCEGPEWDASSAGLGALCGVPLWSMNINRAIIFGFCRMVQCYFAGL